MIFVDGLPGSGKSTTAEYVARQLEQHGIPCRLLGERETDHPLNVGGDLRPSGSTTGRRMFAACTVASFIAESLARWDAFVAEAMDSDRVNVLDSYPFQNSVRVLSQMDADPIGLTAYQSRVEETTAALGPVLIYLDPGEPERAFRAIAEQRGPVWTDYAIAVVTECPYASSRGLRGMDGVVAIMRAYKHVLDESVRRFPFPKLVLSDCHRRWPECHGKIRESCSPAGRDTRCARSWPGSGAPRGAPEATEPPARPSAWPASPAREQFPPAPPSALEAAGRR